MEAGKLGRAKLIIRFPFQRFQNTMLASGHFSLFIMAKILGIDNIRNTINQIQTEQQ